MKLLYSWKKYLTVNSVNSGPADKIIQFRSHVEAKGDILRFHVVPWRKISHPEMSLPLSNLLLLFYYITSTDLEGMNSEQ